MCKVYLNYLRTRPRQLFIYSISLTLERHHSATQHLLIMPAHFLSPVLIIALAAIRISAYALGRVVDDEELVGARGSALTEHKLTVNLSAPLSRHRWQQGGGEDTYCPLDWPSESGRFENPSGRKMQDTDPVWWYLGHKDDYFVHILDAGKPDAPLNVEDPMLLIAPNARPGARALLDEPRISQREATCCRPTWDCYIHNWWLMQTIKGENGRRLDSSEQEALGRQKSRCCFLQYEMSCELPQTFEGLRDGYVWEQPPACSPRANFPASKLGLDMTPIQEE